MSLSIYSQKKNATIALLFLCGLGRHKKNAMAAEKIFHPNTLSVSFSLVLKYKTKYGSIEGDRSEWKTEKFSFPFENPFFFSVSKLDS